MLHHSLRMALYIRTQRQVRTRPQKAAAVNGKLDSLATISMHFGISESLVSFILPSSPSKLPRL